MSNSLFLVLLICFQLSYNVINVVKADEALMKQECHHAYNSEICMQCLESYLSSKLATRPEIAGILVTYLCRHAAHLKGNTSSLVITSSDKGLQQAYQGCSKSFVQAEKELFQASRKLKRIDFDGADNHVGLALKYEGECYEGMYLHDGFHMPDEVRYEMAVFEDLCEGTMRMLDRL